MSVQTNPIISNVIGMGQDIRRLHHALTSGLTTKAMHGLKETPVAQTQAGIRALDLMDAEWHTQERAALKLDPKKEEFLIGFHVADYRRPDGALLWRLAVMTTQVRAWRPGAAERLVCGLIIRDWHERCGALAALEMLAKMFAKRGLSRE